jgi:hypothetical protein
MPVAAGVVGDDRMGRTRRKITGLLLKAASEAMLTVAADPKHLGARIVMICSRAFTEFAIMGSSRR